MGGTIGALLPLSSGWLTLPARAIVALADGRCTGALPPLAAVAPRSRASAWNASSTACWAATSCAVYILSVMQSL
jgi:hypothetical protein